MSVGTGEALKLGGLRWAETGHSDRCAWGRCQGSAALPYETVVVAGSAPRTSCTCQSRRRPCKHALGLLLAWAEDHLPERAEPDYARAAAARLAARPEPTPRSGPPADPEGAARRADLRRQRVADGLDELDRWLADQVRSGLAGLSRAGYAPVEAVAARMTDAQAPGVAATVRALPGELVGDDWPERAMHLLGGLHLLVRAHQRLDHLPSGLAATVRSRIGYPQARADVLAGPGVEDVWWPLGGVDTVEYQLETRRLWLYGAETGRWALWLTFAPPGQSLDTSVVPGSALPAALHFYPGSGQYRALIGAGLERPLLPWRVTGQTVAETRSRFAALLAEDPWASRMPVILQGVPIRSRLGAWGLRDADGAICPLTGLDAEPWPLLAASGGAPMGVFGEWGSQGLTPMSLLPDERGRTFSTRVCG